MSVVVSVEDVGPCRKKLKIEVPAPAVAAETERVVAEFGRKAKVPGFRAGKVPAAVVRRRFAADIEHEVVDRLLPRYWRQAQAEANLDPLLPPQVEDVHLHEGTPLTFSATVETRPVIELRNTHDFNLPEMPTEPEPGEVERALEDLRRGFSDWDVVARPAGQGDRVDGTLVELTLIEPSQPMGEPQPVTLEVGDPAIWEELSLAAAGLQSGQSAEFTRREESAPPDAGAEPPADPPAAPVIVNRRFRFSLGEVRERRLPPLDDAFAERVGKFPSAAALKLEVEKRLREAKRAERGRRRESAVLDQLRERHPTPLPEGVVEHEQESLLRDYAENLARRGVDPEKAQVDWPALAQEVKPQAERRVHARLLLDAVAEAEALVVSEDEFERALASIARAEGRSTPAVRQALDEAGKLGPLRAQLRREKALTRLLGEGPAATPEAALP